MSFALVLFLSIGVPIIIVCIALLSAWILHIYHGRIVLTDAVIAEIDEQEIQRSEQEYLQSATLSQQQAYHRAKLYTCQSPPDSISTDITLSQFLSIQEKGVSAWQFEPDLENANCFVEARTEIAFYDTECSVQSNLPLPKQNDVYYWETKIYEKPENTTISIGLGTKPYPSFRLPGWSKNSIGYFSNGLKYQNYPFNGKSYGPQMYQGDVIGVGYRPRTGTIFFTRNGKKLEDVCNNWKFNLFPSVGADGPCSIHVNFGQSGFVFIEANVKKWGLAPMIGTLAPPPAYGLEHGSILLLESRNINDRLNMNNNNNQVEQEETLILSDNLINSSRVTDISLSAITSSPPSYSVQDQYRSPFLPVGISTTLSSSTSSSSSSHISS